MKRRQIKLANEVALKQERNIFGDNVQNLAMEKLISLGYRVCVYPLNNPKFKFDLEAKKDLTIKIEVKGARLCQSGRRGKRYRATLSKSEIQADILLFYCQQTWFVIPVCEILPRRHISIWSANPEESRGQWAKFRENWGLLDEYEFQPEYLFND